MLLRLFNWVPVLFGLNIAGVASVATVPDVLTGEPNGAVKTSESADAHSKPKDETPGRTSSGSAVTRLMASTSVAPILTESFVFAEGSVETSAAVVKTSPAKQFVVRPVAVSAPRPTARLKAAKSAGKETVHRQPGQVKQNNRPAARANLKVEGRKVAKRVVWIAGRNAAPLAASNVIAFPKPLNRSASSTRRAA